MIPNPKEVEEGTHSEEEDSGVNPCSSSKVEEVNSLEEEEAEGDNSSISDGVDQGRFVLFSSFRSSFAFSCSIHSLFVSNCQSVASRLRE